MDLEAPQLQCRAGYIAHESPKRAFRGGPRKVLIVPPGLLLTVTPSCAAGIRITLPPSSRSSFDPDGKIARQPRPLALSPRAMESMNQIASANRPREQRHLHHPELGPTRIQSAGWEPIGANLNQSATSSPPCTNEPPRNYRDCPSGGKVSIQRGRSTRAYEKKGGQMQTGSRAPRQA